MFGRSCWWALVAAAVLWSGSAAWGQEFYVVAGGGPPVGTKITSLPCEIKNSGFYFLSGNLTYDGSGSGYAITISADNVTLDLMGFTLTGPYRGGGTGNCGIFMSGRSNVEVRNGTICFFGYGILEVNGKSHRVINVRTHDNTDGIWLQGQNHLIKNCGAFHNNGTGLMLESGMIIDCVASDCVPGIDLRGPGSVLENTVFNNTYWNFLLGNNVATSILVDRNSSFGQNPNYFIRSNTTGVVITANNSGTP